MQLKEVLQRHNFTCSKRYGQNFLSDPQLLRSIAACGADAGDKVVEVGAGAGTLTRALCEMGARVTAFEIDEKLRPVLQETLAGTDANVVFADVMQYDLAHLGDEPFRLVANLPYYITTPVIFRFLYDPRLLSLTIMVQKEVAERMCAEAGTPAYGALSAQMQAMGQVCAVREVSRRMFLPAPEVDSAVVRLDICPRVPREQLPAYRKTVAAAFAMRRKTLANNLTAAFGLTKPDAERAVEEVCGNKAARGETLNVEQFAALSDLLFAGGGASCNP
ncbi:MAG: 16S rRNA (adenine(1518)-N(6)/adenine(1519)-N(6))-dimethyltransferase RsmA [Clostridiales bacterium]|nr:16S rRNA (adenine(1518)-N(6)/adenine(1519)-N(6))-dimethyltransferase RsmA [Clostridiales bacterium]